MMRRTRASAQLLALALASCGAPKAGPPATEPEAPLAASPPPEAATSGASLKAPDLSPPELGEVSRLRGLEATAPVALRRLSRDQLKMHLEESLDSHMPRYAIEGTEAILIALGVVPREFHYRDAIIQLMQSELAGLYDPAENVMFLLADLSKEMEKATLQHELVHALQDQHYTLDRITSFSQDQTDQMSALSSLAEGDATSLMFDAVLAPEHKTALDIPSSILERQLVSASERPETNGIPSVLVRALLAPYVDGVAFVHRLRTRGGFAEVDRAWQDPPTTTEQLLHEDRYDRREAAVVVALPPAPSDAGGPWTDMLHDVWGEQSWRVVLEEFATRSVAQSAAAGWGGDRVVVYQRGAERAVAAVIVMDSEADAQEFELALRSRGPAPPTRNRAASVSGQPDCRESANGAALSISRKGRSLVLAAAPWGPGRQPQGCTDSNQYNLRILATL